MATVAHVITHNKKLLLVCLEGEEAANAKMEELKGAYNLEKDFQVAASDTWTVEEVLCN